VPDVAAALTAPGAAVDVATGLVLVAAGAVAHARGRGPLLLVAGVAWLAGDVWDGLVYAHRGPLAHLVLGASPLTALVYLDGLVTPLARSAWITLALAAAVVASAAWRSRSPRAPLAALVVAGALAFEAIGRLTGHDTAGAAAWWYDVAIAAVAVAYALGGRPRPVSAVAADLVIDLAASPGALQAALARAVGDPTLDVAFRVEGEWVDEAGRPARLPAAEDTRVVRPIDDLAILMHDPAALRDAALARSVDSAVRLALVNVRLQAEVAARLREVELSRRRLVEAGDAERRHLRERLREGAEGHLVAADAALATVPGAAPLRAELAGARADLGRFAQGVHPRALGEQGLAEVLRALAAPLGAELALEPVRAGSAAETAAYFVCSEALANVVKYAPGAHVRISLAERGGLLVLEVADDGPGGADPARGSGLRGLADRVEALGGTLEVASPPGGGTRMTAVLPPGDRLDSSFAAPELAQVSA
jgi:signal transduction histidine kinase